MTRYRIIVKGVVQGVGFRPTVYNIALNLGLTGFVTNTSDGVIIEVEGDNVAGFESALKDGIPPLARIESLEASEMAPAGYTEFKIIESVEAGGFTHVAPDISICDDCLKELLDPADHRFQYPFINCTNCGPRYSITKKVPYDRPNTTMSVFPMCAQCSAEYHDPLNRRFHAQPNACPECGPQVKLKINNEKFKDKGNKSDAADPIAAAIEMLKQGAIVAVKGIGGFHLCCDAENEAAVKLLRERKMRRNKAFALMSPDAQTVRRFCEVSADEAAVLLDMRRPIVLLRKRDDLALTDAIAPKNRYLGFMLPYTPLHYLLFNYSVDGAPLEKPHFNAIVATSGNLSEEPIVTDNEEALKGLAGLADAFLLHNRDIFMRVDDSVVRVSDGKTLFIRRSRGYAPQAIIFEEDMPDVFGSGAEVKNTFTITKGNAAILSQHIGDMENLETLRFFEETLNNLKQVYRCEPEAVAYDLHPGYLASAWARKKIAEGSMKGLGIQHHYAHIAAVMAGNGISDKVIGVAWDGSGYGEDGNIWGGEFLVCDFNGYERVAHLAYVPLPGGEKAIRENWRIAVSYLRQVFGDEADRYLEELGFIERFGKQKIELLLRIMDDKSLSPLSCGAGRLFDAVSALAGICHESTYEGEAAVALESALPEDGEVSDHGIYGYHVSVTVPYIIDICEIIRGIVADIMNGVPQNIISLRFHNTVIQIIIDIVLRIRDESRIDRVALSGGCFQNAYLLDGVTEGLKSQGFSVFINEAVPCNDGCVSLGQAYILGQRFKTGRDI
jgi:hydrogenase maturation protein HypF